MAPESTKTPRLGLSLYANLLDPNNTKPSAPGTISRAPVVFKQPDGGTEGYDGDVSAQKQQPNAASLRFQPTKRPQLSTQKTKAKPALQKTDPSVASAQGLKVTSVGESIFTTQQPTKTTISDWAAEPEDDDVHGYHPAEKRQRGGRKKRKKNKESYVVQNWDDIYDPSRPNSYEEYQNSDEKILEIREWKDRLYAYRTANHRTSSVNVSSDEEQGAQHTIYRAPGLLFAPPTDFGSNSSVARIVGDPTGEEVYVRRLNLSRAAGPIAHSVFKDKMERPVSATMTPLQSWMPDPGASSVDSLQSAVPSISRAPIRYSLPPPPPEIPNSETELVDALQEEDTELEDTAANQAPRSSRPGQKGFAERLMSKYGWTKGSGLGASGTGIVNPLRVQIEKQKKKPDAEGGGYVGPGGRGKIIGGKKVGAEAEGGKFGPMSEVVVLRGMLNGLDLDAETERAEDGGLLQEIGDECGEKYGRVERVYIDRSGSPDPRVFVKFTSQLSALRAVNALEGRIFNGNTITAMFHGQEKFDSGVYD